MTLVGAGGVVITRIEISKRFKKQFKKSPLDIQKKLASKLLGLQADPRPAGIRFEKLKGYTKPNIYTLHITGNYKVSLEINGSVAYLRCIGEHNEIDRLP